MYFLGFKPFEYLIFVAFFSYLEVKRMYFYGRRRTQFSCFQISWFERKSCPSSLFYVFSINTIIVQSWIWTSDHPFGKQAAHSTKTQPSQKMSQFMTWIQPNWKQTNKKKIWKAFWPKFKSVFNVVLWKLMKVASAGSLALTSLFHLRLIGSTKNKKKEDVRVLCFRRGIASFHFPQTFWTKVKRNFCYLLRGGKVLSWMKQCV